MDEATRQFTNPFTGETRSIPEGIEIRAGRPDDQAAVKELCLEADLFGGLDWDFVPGMWGKFMDNPNFVVVVAESKGKLVCVAGTHIVNKGKHWILFGSRSAPSVRGKNVFWACMAHKVVLCLNRFGPPDKYMALTGGGQEVKMREGGKMKFQAVGYKHFMFAGMAIDVTDLQTISDHVTSALPASSNCKDVISIVQTADELAQLFSPTDPSDTSFYLFPEGYIKVMYAPVEAISQTAYDIWDEDYRWFAVARNAETKRVTSLSIASSFAVGPGCSVEIEVYGENDVDTVLAHVKAHLPHVRRAHERWGGKVYLVLAIAAHHSREPIMELFGEKLKLHDKENALEGVIVMLTYDKPEIRGEVQKNGSEVLKNGSEVQKNGPEVIKNGS